MDLSYGFREVAALCGLSCSLRIGGDDVLPDHFEALPAEVNEGLGDGARGLE